MKKVDYFLLLIVSFFMFSLNASAKRIVIVTGDEVRFRTEPTVKSTIITEFNRNTELDLINEDGGSGNGCTKWYRVKYNDKEGYICSAFVTIKDIPEETINPEDFEEYSEYLSEMGFLDSYIPSLIKLHTLHPNWEFKVLKSTISFDKFLDVEYDGRYKGWSLIEDTARYIDGYKSTDSWSYNYLTDTFYTNFTGGGKYWYAANKQTIAYYMDPRNFFNEKQIFMFETLTYNPIYHTVAGVENMLKGTFMQGYADEANQKTYVDAFIDGALKYNISPYVLVSRVIQEVGTKGSTITSGTVAGYEGYYNFYNINAAGDTHEETIANGLKYAKSENWSTHYAAIYGGAKFIAESYIKQGQETLYLQKWDLFGPLYGANQYMQNIQAPSTESIKTYNGYKSVNLVDSSFTFLIPVYDNMPEKTVLPNSGSPNNYLESLAVNGNYLFKTANTQTEYELNLDGSTKSVLIAASKLNKDATVGGTGTVTLNSDDEIIEIPVTAANGDIRVYKINIKRNDTTKAIDISEILNVLSIKNDGEYIYGYSVGTDTSSIIKSITDKEPRASVSYTSYDGNAKVSGKIASGDKIKITTDHEEKTYTIIIYGDVNADGAIDKLDYLQVLRHFYKYVVLDEFYKICADVNQDGTIDKLDYLAVLRDFYNYAKIVQ